MNSGNKAERISQLTENWLYFVTQKNSNTTKSAGHEGSQAASYLRQVLDINPSLIFAKDRQGRFTLANKAVADLFGTTVEDLIGKTDADFNKEKKEVDNFRNDDLEVIELRKEKIIAEEQLTDSEGRTHWLQTIKRPIIKDDGTASEVLGVATDITKIKEVEQILLKTAKIISRQSDRELFLSISGLLFKKFALPFVEIASLSPRGDHLTIFFVSHKGKEITKHRGSFRAGPNTAKVIRTKSHAIIEQKESSSTLFRSQIGIDDCKYLAIYPLLDSHDNVIGTFKIGSIHEFELLEPFSSIMQIITSRISNELQRLITEKTLRISEAKFRGYFESPLVGIAISKESGSFIDFNDKFCRIVGYTRRELLQMSWGDLIDSDDLSLSVISPVGPGHNKNNDLTLKRRYRHRNGSILHLMISTGLIDSDQNKETFLTVVQDVTAQVLAAEENAKLQLKLQQSQKLESLGVLAGGIAHDFNNILMGILGNASIAIDQLDRHHPLIETLKKITLAGERASELTDQILAYAGKGGYKTIQMNVATVISEMVSLLDSAISKNIKLNFNIVDKESSIFADSTQFRQIIMNLITNGSDSLEGRPGTIEVSIFADKADNIFSDNDTPIIEAQKNKRYVCIAVEDSGCGIPDEEFLRIFEPFYSTKNKGHGLGLSAILGIVKAHDGALSISSKVGFGTTFKVLFPALENNVTSVTQENNGTTSSTVHSGLAVVIDDETIVRETLTAMLEAIGYQVVAFPDALSGLTAIRLKDISPTVIILDLTLPDLSGVEALKELRKFDTETPVLLSSGYTDFDIGDILGDPSYLASFIQKPYTSKRLKQSLEKAISLNSLALVAQPKDPAQSDQPEA